MEFVHFESRTFESTFKMLRGIEILHWEICQEQMQHSIYSVSDASLCADAFGLVRIAIQLSQVGACQQKSYQYWLASCMPILQVRPHRCRHLIRAELVATMAWRGVAWLGLAGYKISSFTVLNVSVYYYYCYYYAANGRCSTQNSIRKCEPDED